MVVLFCLFGGFVVGFGVGLVVVAFKKAFNNFNQLPM